MANLKIFCDGGSRGNPGPSATAFIIYEGDKEIFRQGKFIGKGTNNTAEYTAVINALNWLVENNKTEDVIEFFLDSDLVVKQMGGIYKIKSNPIFELAYKVKQLEDRFKNKITYKHIPRNENAIADALVNKTMDDFFA